MGNRHDRRANARKQRHPKLWRKSFTDPDRCVALCDHLLAELEHHLSMAVTIGETIKLTKAEVARCDVDAFMPVDLTEGEKLQWAEQQTRFWLWHRSCKCDNCGYDGCVCETCGHVALGPLTQSTAEERQQWQRELDELEDDASDVAVRTSR
jgi:hypothetical protein